MRLFKLIGVTIIYLSITVLLRSNLVYAQDEDSLKNEFEERLHSYQATTLPYQIFVPEANNKDNSYPLILCLHGAGERGSGDSEFLSKHGLATSWVEPELQKENPEGNQRPWEPWYMDSNLHSWLFKQHQ